MKHRIQTAMVAISLLAAGITMQAFAQTSKPQAAAQMRDGKDQCLTRGSKAKGDWWDSKNKCWWRDTKGKGDLRDGKDMGDKGRWGYGKDRGDGDLRDGNRDAWRSKWRANDPKEQRTGNSDAWRMKWRANDPNDTRMGSRAYASPVNVNTASSAQLRSLPNVGPQTAASIIRNRPYRNIAQFYSANKRFISPLEWRILARRVRL